MQTLKSINSHEIQAADPDSPSVIELAAPEPPAGFNPQQPGYQEPQGSGNAPRPNGPKIDEEFLRLRSMANVSQILAVVSLVFGGVILSVASLVVALMARSRITAYAQKGTGNAEAAQILDKTVKIAMVMSVAAIALNVISIIVLYPIVMDMAQTGDYAALFGAEAPISTGSTTWG